MRSSAVCLGSFFLTTALAAMGCSGTTEPLDAATADMGADAGAADVGSDTSVAPDAADAAPPSDTGPSDAARDAGLAACALPLGGTCARGATCPAGDGCNDCTCPASGGDAMCTARPCATRDAGTHDAGMCSGPGDCRLFASYCSTAPCMCVALGASQPDPVCHGTTVSCIVNPCGGHTASCAAGVCTDSSAL